MPESPSDHSPATTRLKWRSRGIPWLNVVRFHKEIAARAEEGFFSLNARDEQADRWSSLNRYSPDRIDGPWAIDQVTIRSGPFRLGLEQGDHETVFLGGPCYLGWEKINGTSWVPSWRPLLFREVVVQRANGGYQLVPKQGAWALSPLLLSLLNQFQANAGGSLGELATRIIERSATYRREMSDSWEAAIMRSTLHLLPELSDALGKRLGAGDVATEPTPWVLFAPTTKFSALNRNLMADYQLLESVLAERPEEVGGLRLLDAEMPSQPQSEGDVLPVVPLNPLQHEAVRAVLSDRPLTVISGPPGCGKSQVVVSVLLNAWARGVSVLFASNNNKAVDVVRERLERFESEFPVAVRAGNREKNNVIELLRRTLNMATGAATGGATQNPSALRAWRETAQKERSALVAHLDSHLPQRTSEALKTALRGYAESQRRRSDLERRDSELRARARELGFQNENQSEVASAIASATAWFDKVTRLVAENNEHAVERSRLTDEATQRARVRDAAVAGAGLDDSRIDDWNWLTAGPQPTQLDAWEAKLQSLLDEPLELALEKYPWRSEFNHWTSERDASESAAKARAFCEELRIAVAQLAPKVQSINAAEKKLRTQTEVIQREGLEARDEIRIETLKAWGSVYAELATRERTRWDFLPWTEFSSLKRRLVGQERVLRSWVPLSVWTEIGTLNDSGRVKLGRIIEMLRTWADARDAWDALAREREDLESLLLRLRTSAAQVGLESIPSEPSPERWRSLLTEAEQLTVVATEASESWRRRANAEATAKRLATIAREWQTLASGHPLKVEWSRSFGSRLEAELHALLEGPTPERVTALRAAYYSGALGRLRTAWANALQEELARQELLRRALELPTERDLITQCWSAAPKEHVSTIHRDKSIWPDLAAWQQEVSLWENLSQEWSEFSSRTKPQELRAAAEECAWAVGQLKKAVELLPQAHRTPLLEAQIAEIERTPESEWPVDAISAAFSQVSPELLRARIEQIDAQLQKRSFEDAKADWLDRLRSDTQGIQALDALERALQANRMDLPETELPTFQRVLRLVPIWVTNAHAAQAIPLAPEVFDLVVIDEASQCTLTNLLPLVYRGKRLAVIGDSEQLPAIPTIQELEERVLATKHGVIDHLGIIGHCGNDVYKTATESLPRRRADVLQLNEHFRSNPLIIGFSNRHIYQQRLILSKDPARSAPLPIGSGVHRLHVSGVAEKGPRGRSWFNQPEGRKVIDLIERIRGTAGVTDRSLGVVTPFAAQKDWLRDQLDRRQLSSDVLVDSAYGFQGDERDIIIFSPVVANGVTPSACRWVESPPNLINVALTRAREALFVVADFDYCAQQEGVLRKLAAYCRDVQLLRETSPAELELFSWMIVQGWNPKVHPLIGDVEADFELQCENGRRLAIEIDGDAYHSNRREADKARDAFLQAQGYVVLRVSARQVLETPFEVVNLVAEKLRS